MFTADAQVREGCDVLSLTVGMCTPEENCMARHIRVKEVVWYVTRRVQRDYRTYRGVVAASSTLQSGQESEWSLVGVRAVWLYRTNDYGGNGV